jgi:acyl-CoA dehydrogenase
MDFSFPPDSVMLRDMLRRFVEKEARPLEMKYFTAGGLEAKERGQLRKVIEQMGLWGIMAPEEFGGGGLDSVTACLLEEELGKTFIPLEMGEVPPLLFACQGEQVEQFLEPALAGSRRAFLAVREPAATRPEDWSTCVKPQGEGYVLDGAKLVSAKPGAEDFLIVLAKDEGSVSAFILEAAHPGISLAGNGQVILNLNECQLEPGALLGERGQAFKIGAEEAPRTWIRIGARFVGLADRMVAMAADYAREWVALGAPLMNRPAIRRMLAETDVRVSCARWLVYHAAWLADQNESLHFSAAEVRLATGEMLQEVANLVTMIYGGPGPIPEPELGAMFRNAIPMEALELGLENARAIISANILAGGKES